ncbi:hypothetical protein Nepgr_009875 [Nepenthes gracilis]|uniref:UV radiation resistance-associated gene protein n=1 Tax=Nepenthes gracilis TaxID=150966 RepID=A0AAD3SC46_NEPGR|nr:hypothetical protein Nepgr_009875 [Nepenthes gracilis]
MDPAPTGGSSKSIKSADDPDHVKVIQWEDFDQELARLWSLSSALNEAKEKKQNLQQKLETLIRVQAESLARLNELDEIRQRLEDRKLVMGNMLMQSKVVEEHAKMKVEHLSSEIKSLLVSGTSLSAARKRLQDSTILLSGNGGHIRLRNLLKMLRTRQQFMISQVSFLYPVKSMFGPAQELELDSFPSGSRPGTPSGSPHDNKPRNQGTLTISGLQLSMLPFTQMSFFTDKKQVQRSATALGYVAHAISLIASYLHVPLRYPLRLGGSHSFIKDFAPSVELTSSSNAVVSANMKHLEFPLFIDGQDATRTAYAVFLLNKDIEQLLNYLGVTSLGPRQVLANLKELLRTILSLEFIDK